MRSVLLFASAIALGAAVSACSTEGASTSGSGGLAGAGGGAPQGGTTGGTNATTGGSLGTTGGAISTGGASGSSGNGAGGASTGGSANGGTSTGGNSTAGASTGGTTTGGTSTGGSANGGTSTGGNSTAGASTGGVSAGGSGGTHAGGKSSGGTSAGGSSSGGAATGGAAGGGGVGGGIPMKNPAVPSAGCGKATTVTSGKKTITSTNQERTYIIDVPTNYDMNKPYRLFYTSHWINGTSEQVRDQNYYFLKPLANAANEPAIFVAPQSDGGTWQQKDHALFDDILAFVKQNLCIDTTRIFATGFSFGGMITYSLSVNHQKDIRAAVGIAPANYNIYVPPKNHQPIAWMQTTGMGDTTCPWVNGSSTTQGAKFIAIEHATDNGCTVPSTIPIWQQGNHVCYDFQGCRSEFPTKVCTFNGGHTNIANEGNMNWIPQESWKFFTQF